MTTIFDDLRGLQSLMSVSDEGVQWLASHVEARDFAPGEVLISQGENSRECYFIVHGETEVRRDGMLLAISGEGEPEGELGLFLKAPRAATTTARGPVSTFVLQPADWDQLREHDPHLADEIRVKICRHLARRFGLPSFAGVSLA